MKIGTLSVGVFWRAATTRSLDVMRFSLHSVFQPLADTDDKGDIGGQEEKIDGGEVHTEEGSPTLRRLVRTSIREKPSPSS